MNFLFTFTIKALLPAIAYVMIAFAFSLILMGNFIKIPINVVDSVPWIPTLNPIVTISKSFYSD